MKRPSKRADFAWYVVALSLLASACGIGIWAMADRVPHFEDSPPWWAMTLSVILGFVGAASVLVAIVFLIGVFSEYRGDPWTKSWTER